MNKPTYIHTTPKDNVAIAAGLSGLIPGDVIMGNISVKDLIPMGHKVALNDLQPGDPIIRYGYTIGTANCLIAQGSWIQETMLNIPDAPILDQLQYKPKPSRIYETLEGYTFEGYRNEDGSVARKCFGYQHECSLCGRHGKLCH